MLCRWLFTLLTLVMSCSTAFADSFTVTVKVVDGANMPVPKADLSLFWEAKDRAMTPVTDKAAVTDAAGKAVLRVDDWNEKRPLLILSADRMLGAIVGVSKAEAGKEIVVALGPTVRVKGQLECKELNVKPDWSNTTVAVEGFRAFFTQNSSKSAAFAFVLPAGKYTLTNYGKDVEDAKQTVAVTADRSEIDLGTIDLKASPVAKLRGKTPPDWVIADARGMKAEAKLADFKGKWVYLEFWGHW